MAIIKDFKTSKAHRASTTRTWVWEVIVQEFDELYDEYYDNIAAVFFDPWKAVQYVCTEYNGAAIVQCSLYHTDYLKGE